MTNQATRVRFHQRLTAVIFEILNDRFACATILVGNTASFDLTVERQPHTTPRKNYVDFRFYKKPL
jgi:hypothetical protein